MAPSVKFLGGNWRWGGPRKGGTSFYEGSLPGGVNELFSHVLVALDGSPQSDHALDMACDLVREAHGELTLVSVVPHPALVQPPDSWAVSPVVASDTPFFEALLRSRKERAEARGVPVVRTLLLEGHVVDSILERLESHPPSLLVVGSRGLSTARRLLLGSVSDALVHHARCPILLIKE